MGRWDRGRCLNTSRTLSTGYKGPGGSRVGCREEESVVGDGDGGDQGRTNCELSNPLSSFSVRGTYGPPPPPAASHHRRPAAGVAVFLHCACPVREREHSRTVTEGGRPREDKKQEGEAGQHAARPEGSRMEGDAKQGAASCFSGTRTEDRNDTERDRVGVPGGTGCDG